MKRILVVRTDRVGDVVMITPTLRELRKTNPDAFIGTLTQPHTKNILLNNPNVDVNIVDDLEKGSYWSVVKEIRKHKFTHGLLIMPTERAAYQMFLAGIPNRIGVGHKLYEVITLMRSVSRNNYIPLRHEADYDMDLARKIGVKSGNLLPEIFLTETEKAKAEDFYKTNGLTNKDKIIMIHTGSKGSAPNWSEDKYFALIKNILSKYDSNFKLFLTAFEMTSQFLKKIKKLHSDRIFDVSNELSNLRDLIIAISKADIFIGSSTGPLHIADALMVKSIGLFCSRPMSCSVHWGVLNDVSVNLEISKEYCKKNCSSDQNTCAFEDGIKIEQVLESMNKLLLKE